MVLVTTLVTGITYSEWAFWIQLAILFGRVLFALGYTRSGPDARYYGVLFIDLGILASLILSVSSIVKLAAN